jgi:hypothetical protein
MSFAVPSSAGQTPSVQGNLNWNKNREQSRTMFLIFYGGLYGEISVTWFSHNVAKNSRHDLKVSCIDASRRQLQYALKQNGV